uniref:Ectonucleotide pyrophosphatase/phosphodiesterase 7 n=1 Tax=Loxodonta africana TaxID=9785 RepID=G3UMM2_LOXAF
PKGSRNKLLLVSFDGFRWNYDQDVDTPNLDAMACARVKACYMTPAFVTTTRPCHFTLVTGRYIKNHRVVHDMFYSTTSKVKLPYHTTLGIQGWQDNGSLPIWITAQRQSRKIGHSGWEGLKTGLPQRKCHLPRHVSDPEQEWRANIDTVMRWFTEDGLDLVTLYFWEHDSTGHKFGPESAERKDVVGQVDRTTGYLHERNQQSGLASSLNLIYHGMTTINKTASDLVELHKFPNFTFKDIEFELLNYGTNGMLLPKDEQLDKVYGVLRDMHPKLHVYKELFPKSFHYANNPQIMPLLMYSDPGYIIHRTQHFQPERTNTQFNNGEHGFDNGAPDMKTIFQAAGPRFRTSLEVEPREESVHVYELMCKLLGIVPEANGGSLSSLVHLLHPDEGSTPSPPATP